MSLDRLFAIDRGDELVQFVEQRRGMKSCRQGSEVKVSNFPLWQELSVRKYGARVPMPWGLLTESVGAKQGPLRVDGRFNDGPDRHGPVRKAGEERASSARALNIFRGGFLLRAHVLVLAHSPPSPLSRSLALSILFFFRGVGCVKGAVAQALKSAPTSCNVELVRWPTKVTRQTYFGPSSYEKAISLVRPMNIGENASRYVSCFCVALFFSVEPLAL